MNRILLPLVGVSMALGFCHSASAYITLYDNGPINGGITAWLINNGPDPTTHVTSDSFTVAPGTSIGGIDFGAWVSPGDTIQQVGWAISPGPDFGIPYFTGVASVISKPAGSSTNPAGYQLEEDSFSTGTVYLATGGTYYLSLFSAVTAHDLATYWDQNNGPSTAYTGAGTTSIGSESFDVVPEPSGVIPIVVGVGIIGLLAFRRRTAIV